MHKPIFKNISWALIGRICAALFQTAGIILLARWESLEHFGIMASALALGTVIHAFIDFGFSTYIIKERAISPSSPRIMHSLIITSISTKIFNIMAIALLILIGINSNTFYFYLIPLPLWISYERKSEQLLGVLIADGDNKKATQLLTLRRIYGFVFFIILHVVTTWNDSLLFSTALLLGAWISHKQTFYLIKNQLEQPVQNIPHMQLFKQAFPYWINSLFAQLRNIDVMLVTIISNPMHGAFFGFVNRAVSPLNMVAISAASVLLPSVAKNEIDSKHYYKVILITTTIASLPFVTLYFLADYIIPSFLGENYVPTILLIKIICLGLIFFSASSIIGSILQGVHQQKNVATVNIVSTTLYLLSVIPMTLAGQSLYATYALIIFFFIRFLSMLYFLHSHLNSTRKYSNE